MSPLTVGHAVLPPSSWVRRFAAALLPAGAEVLDVACGHGRHARWLAERGHTVCAVDRDAAALNSLVGCAGVEPLQVDLERGIWPFAQRQFDAVVVTHYLWRPLWPHLQQALRPGGVLIYETFSQGHERFGRPSRPDFLLQRGELLRAFSDLQIVAYEDGHEHNPDRCMQRLAALKPGATAVWAAHPPLLQAAHLA